MIHAKYQNYFAFRQTYINQILKKICIKAILTPFPVILTLDILNKLLHQFSARGNVH